MTGKSKAVLRAVSPYNASISREQFMFYEIRTTAKLICEGLGEDDVVERVVRENLYQYPTERTVKRIARACLRRLDALSDESLVSVIAGGPSDVAKQVCLYAMMKQYRIVWDFMITVIGSKYQNLDTTYSKMDLNGFFMRLQEQNDGVATWSDTTVAKVKQVLAKILVENEYLDSLNSDHLNPVLISRILEDSIRKSGDVIGVSDQRPEGYSLIKEIYVDW